MFNSAKQTAVAALAAMLFTFTSVAAAVGPARAVVTAPASLVAATNSGHVIA